MTTLCGDNGYLRNARIGDKNTCVELQWREGADDKRLKKAE